MRTGDVLLLDAYVGDPPGRATFERFLGPTRAVRCAREPVPRRAAGLAGIVITGSAASAIDLPEWAAPMLDLLRDARASGVPVLGVCFGHQLIARAFAGDDAVFERPLPEVGWAEIETGEDLLFEGLPRRFTTFVSHAEEVRASPPLSVIARGSACPVQALAVDGAPIRGVQFHCEMGREETEALVRSRARNHPDLHLDMDAAIARWVDGAPIAERLFGNWLRRFVGRG